MSDEHSGDSAAAEMFRLVTAALVGGLIGAGIALALAPKPGPDFRAEVKARAASAADTAQQVVGAKARELVAAAKQKIEQHRAHGEEGEAPAETPEPAAETPQA